MSDLSRRQFIQDSTLLAAGAGLAAATELGTAPVASAAETDARPFVSRWEAAHDRVWLGAEFWANPLQDWRLTGGRAECVNPAMDRNVHLLTRQLGERPGDLRMSVRLGRIGEPLAKGRGSAGFRIGIQGPLKEYRNSLVFGTGLNAGITAAGLFIGDLQSAKAGTVTLNGEAIELRLTARPEGDVYVVTLAAHDAESGRLLAETSRNNVPAERLVGNVALVANFGSPQRGQANAPAGGAGTGKFWFADWRVDGDKLEAHDERAFGPILFNQYAVHGGVMKMTAQMPPLGKDDSQTVRLQLADGDGWKTVAEEPIHLQARTATFRVENWNDKADVRYRLLYAERKRRTDFQVRPNKDDPSSKEGTDGLGSPSYEAAVHEWAGVVRRDPVDKPVLTVADVSCNIHAAFPNTLYVENMAKLDPDLLAFTGDQFYESSGGYGVTREPLDAAILDYLRKWSMHGWTWRELMRDRPSLSIPDDHDVWQGNIWGEAGAPRETTQEAGGYEMPPDWVNVVHRTQTAHHPDPHSPTPVKQDISVYHGPLTWGRVSFAILADRQFKTGPEGVVPPTGGRGDHVTDPNFDPKTADVPGAELLGERQMQFLREWAVDWRGADMKAVISQTIFTGMATTHGRERQRLRADYDSNGWPQTARNEALREIRKAFAVHIAGDQHLPAVVHYGIDEYGDAAVAFAGPAVNVGYPRWWEPDVPGKNRKPGDPEHLGEFTDHLGHPLTVLAVANGAVDPRSTVLEMMHDKTSGIGLVRFDKANRKVTFECWPYLADPTQRGTQFPGWPVTIDLLANYGRKPAAHLPTLEISGVENPVVQVIAEADGETVYTLRIPGRRFRPHVFAAGRYTVRISEPETGGLKELKSLEAVPDNKARLRVEV